MTVTKEAILRVKGESNPQAIDAMTQALSKMSGGLDSINNKLSINALGVWSGAISTATQKLKEAFTEGLRWADLGAKEKQVIEGMRASTKGLIEDTSLLKLERQLTSGNFKATQSQLESVSKAAVALARSNFRGIDDASRQIDILADALQDGGETTLKIMNTLGLEFVSSGNKLTDFNTAMAMLDNKFSDSETKIKTQRDQWAAFTNSLDAAQKSFAAMILSSEKVKDIFSGLTAVFTGMSSDIRGLSGTLKEGSEEWRRYNLSAAEGELAQIKAFQAGAGGRFKAAFADSAIGKLFGYGGEVQGGFDQESLKQRVIFLEKFKADVGKVADEKRYQEEKQRDKEKVESFNTLVASQNKILAKEAEKAIEEAKSKAPKIDLAKLADQDWQEMLRASEQQRKLEEDLAQIEKDRWDTIHGLNLEIITGSQRQYQENLIKKEQEKNTVWESTLQSNEQLIKQNAELQNSEVQMLLVKQQRLNVENEGLKLKVDLIALQDTEVQKAVKATEAQRKFNQSVISGNMAVDNAIDSMKEMALSSLSDMASGLWAAADAAIQGGDSMGVAIAKMTKSMMLGIAQQATVKAIFETAEGFASLAILNGYGAAQHFTAAGIFGSVAGVAGGIGLAMSAAGVGGSASSPSQNRTASEAYRPTYGEKGSAESQKNITVQVIFDRSDPAAESFANRRIKAMMKEAA